MNIGKLKQVDLRTVWQHEALDFTNWLALPENLTILSEEIGLEFSEAQTEVNVGNFHVDILAEEENTGRKIIIENQLEATNHDHLGKIITYASGLDAPIIVWIVKSAREEHERAVDWLNEHTDEAINFFIIKMELWQIGDSDIAPKFHVVSRPNDWAKLIKQSTGSGKISEYKLLQQKFWQHLSEFGSSSKKLRWRKPQPQHWYDISIGKSEAHISLTINRVDSTIGCELYISNDPDKMIYDKLYAHRDEIENQLKYPLKWMRLDAKKASRIKTSIKAEFDDESNWQTYQEWLQAAAEKFYTIFRRFL